MMTLRGARATGSTSVTFRLVRLNGAARQLRRTADDRDGACEPGCDDDQVTTGGPGHCLRRRRLTATGDGGEQCLSQEVKEGYRDH
jgi:hypothetical protein